MPIRNKSRWTLLTISIVMVLILPAYLRAFTLSGASDAPTLLLGDTAIVNTAAYWVRFPYTQKKLTADLSSPAR